jgi:tetratricopeptide (TPR) repeat protein
MRLSSALISAIVVMMLGATAPPAFTDDIDDCERAAGGPQAITACTRVIDNPKAPGEARAVAYNNRGNAYSRSGDTDRALSDYDAAIKLDPTSSSVCSGTLFLGRYDEAGHQPVLHADSQQIRRQCVHDEDGDVRTRTVCRARSWHRLITPISATTDARIRKASVTQSSRKCQFSGRDTRLSSTNPADWRTLKKASSRDAKPTPVTSVT